MPKRKHIYYGLCGANEGRKAYMNAPKKKFIKQRSVRNSMARRSRRINRRRR